MLNVGPILRADVRSFGRGPTWLCDAPQEVWSSLSGDVKLFATTFLAGFVFVSLFLA